MFKKKQNNVYIQDVCKKMSNINEQLKDSIAGHVMFSRMCAGKILSDTYDHMKHDVVRLETDIREVVRNQPLDEINTYLLNEVSVLISNPIFNILYRMSDIYCDVTSTEVLRAMKRGKVYLRTANDWVDFMADDLCSGVSPDDYNRAIWIHNQMGGKLIHHNDKTLLLNKDTVKRITCDLKMLPGPSKRLYMYSIM